MRGIWSRPISKGEVEGDLARGVLAPGGPALGGVPAPGGVCSWGGVETPRDSYCCGRYVSYWNAFLLNLKVNLVPEEFILLVEENKMSFHLFKN